MATSGTATSPADTIASLVAAGVRGRLEAGELVIDAPTAARCPRLRALVEAHRDRLAALLAGGPVGEQEPPAHIAALGGHLGACLRFGLQPAHQLWDAARLWERDQGLPLAGRWAADYWRAWATVKGRHR